MSSAEFTYWVKYAELEPFGYPMDNFRMGVPASAIVNAVHASIPLPKGRRRPKALKPSDFYPEAKRREPELTKEQKEHLRKKHGNKGRNR